MSQLPPEFDDFHPSHYDPQYTADISMQMHVPDHLDVTGDDSNVFSDLQTDDSTTFGHLPPMNVPEKIVVLGQDRSAGVRSEPQLHLNLMPLPDEHSFVNLSTPPRVLTLDDRPFLGVDDAGVADESILTKSATAIDKKASNADVSAIERQLALLSQNVKKLEVENAKRSQRELVLYPLFFGYVIIRVARWLLAAAYS